MADCEHKFVYQHVVYWDGHTMPGSGACYRHYGDKYFCEKCLETVVRNDRVHGNSYLIPIEGTFPR